MNIFRFITFLYNTGFTVTVKEKITKTLIEGRISTHTVMRGIVTVKYVIVKIWSL